MGSKHCPSVFTILACSTPSWPMIICQGTPTTPSASTEEMRAYSLELRRTNLPSLVCFIHCTILYPLVLKPGAENGPLIKFLNDFPLTVKPPLIGDFHGFSIAIFDCQRVFHRSPSPEAPAAPRAHVALALLPPLQRCHRSPWSRSHRFSQHGTLGVRVGMYQKKNLPQLVSE